jgi:hypothetical protein
MPPVGFEPAISVLERTKTVHALDRAATVIGHLLPYPQEIIPVMFRLRAKGTDCVVIRVRVDLFAPV